MKLARRLLVGQYLYRQVGAQLLYHWSAYSGEWIMKDKLRQAFCAIAVGVTAFGFSTGPALAGGCGADGIYGHIVISMDEASEIVWVADPFTVSATLCNNGLAFGGGVASFYLAPPETHINGIEIPEGMAMTFYWDASYFVDNNGPHPDVFGDLHPIGRFRQFLLDQTGGDLNALDGWVADLEAPVPSGGYDFNGDGKVDVRITAWYN